MPVLPLERERGKAAGVQPAAFAYEGVRTSCCAQTGLGCGIIDRQVTLRDVGLRWGGCPNPPTRGISSLRLPSSLRAYGPYPSEKNQIALVASRSQAFSSSSFIQSISVSRTNM